jgi:peroxiredoxin
MSGRTWTRVLAGLGAAASLMVVALAFRVRDLTDEVRHLRFERNLPQVGDVVPRLRAPLLSGDSVELGRPGGGRRQLWFVFDTTCPICRASVGGWNAAFARLAADPTFQVLGVSLDSPPLTRAYVEEHALPFPVAVLDDPLHAAMYRIPGVPLIVVIDRSGRIVAVRPGLFPPAAVDSLVRSAGVPPAGT